MGEAKIRSRSKADILRNCAHCIYCGELAGTVEHMPPRIMFTGKRRPSGFEFAACADCNQRTKAADLFAAFIGRAFPDSDNPIDQEDVKKILKALGRNSPDVLREMNIGRAGQKIARKDTGITAAGGFLRVSGPLVTQLLNIFAHKLALAMHFEATKKALPRTGAVATRVFSNVEHMRGEIPQDIFPLLPKPTSLRQGSWDTEEQFTYSMRVTDDTEMGLFFASFRRSIYIVALTANSGSAFATAANKGSMTPRTPASLWK